MALQLFRSNRMEQLVDALAAVVETPLDHVLSPEWIAVPSPGMERWLSMELSRRFGVWANPAFPFPRALVDSVLAGVLEARELDALAYDPLRTQFALAALLAQHARLPEFAGVRHYMGAEEQAGARRLALAARIADLFDHYITYRPELVLDWQRGREAHWQALLFRALVQRQGPVEPQHLAARGAAALKALAAGARVRSSVPQRIHLFGLSTLPPLYLDLLAAVSEQRQVNLFVLSPCREYYGDLRSQREQRSARQHSSEAPAFASEGHPLLSSLGRHSREFQEVLEARSYVEPALDLYREPGTATLLCALQSDMLSLSDRGTSAELPPIAIDPQDRSVAIHACHSAMREVEVLHDQLLALISESNVEPHEIIVLTPDIAAYAPVIEAVFSQTLGRTRIPFRIADRGVSATHALVSALDALLDVLGSRFAASQVLDLLGQDLVRERFGIAVDEVEVLRSWVADSGIRWGVDASHRAEVGQPERSENTWRFGLARLALGYASGDEPDRMFAGAAPAAVDPGDAELLGRFLELCEQLFAFRLELKEGCALPEWRARLGRILDAFIGEDPRVASEQSALRHALQSLEQHASLAGFTEAIDLATFRVQLNAVLDSRANVQGFLAGGVTFCQLVPMRSIPFQVVCLLGLHDGAFPAIETPLDFDLMAKHRRPGDRRRRDDDRQLFLEALLSARRAFLITYIGQSIHDGKPLLPSVLVTELIDHIARGFSAPDGSIDQRLVTHHPLLAVSPRYFGGDEAGLLFSYASSALAGARAVSEPRQPARTFFRVDAAKTPPPLAAVTLAELEECLVRPLRMFARRQLGLVLGRDLQSTQDREPLELDALERWQVASDVLVRTLEQRAPVDLLDLGRARGLLPLGTPGVLEFRALRGQVDAIAQLLDVHAVSERLAPIEVDLQVGATRLTGSLDQVWPTAQLRVQYSATGNRHELRHFVRHVALQCLRAQRPGSRLPEQSLLIGRDKLVPKQIEFGPLSDPQALLAELVSIYAAAQAGPLPLFEWSSREYGSALASGKSEQQALACARTKFASSYDAPMHDDSDQYVTQFFPDFDRVLASEAPYSFEQLARRVYLPLYACRRTA